MRSFGYTEMKMSAMSKDCEENLMIGCAYKLGSHTLCPVPTTTATAVCEEPELRAYKLGKQKCSYNQVELLFYDVSGQKPAEIKISEAMETCIGAEVEDVLKESCIKFNVRFLNNMRMQLYIYLVYANAHPKLRSPSPSPGPGPGTEYYWMPVTRSKCNKGCVGSVLRGLQRFGRMYPRRGQGIQQDSWKEPSHLYIAINEASSHVCIGPEIPKFRLLLAAYNDQYELLGTTVSSTIRVLANNDAPLGAASLKVHVNLEGGRGKVMPQIPHLRNRSDRKALKDDELDLQLMDGDQTINESANVFHGMSTKKSQRPSENQDQLAQNLNKDRHSDSLKKILKRRCTAPKRKRKAVKNSTVDNVENAMESMPGLVSESEYDNEDFLPSFETECNRLIRRPRLCAPATISTTKNNCASMEGIPKISNPSKNGGSFSSGFDAEKPLSPVKELDHNDTDAVNFEAAAILICLASSDQPKATNATCEIVAGSPSDALAELSSKCLEVDAAFPGPEQEFNPLCYLQRIFSPRQITDLHEKNPGFMIDYVRYSRQLYQRWCAEKFVQSKHMNLFKPVPVPLRKSI